MKRWLAGIACFCLAGALSPFLQAEDEAVPEVVNRYQQMLERSPGEGSAFEKVVQYFQEHGGLPALDTWWIAKGAENGGKMQPVYTLLRGYLAERRNQIEPAGKLFEQSTREAPENFRTWLAWGDFQARQGKLAGAVEAYQKALTLEVPAQERGALYRKLGTSQQRNMDVEGAKATWLKMAAEFPKDSFALDEAASALVEAEAFEEAGKIYQQLVDATEANSMARVQALMKISELRDRQGKTKEAIQGYEAILPQTSTGSWLNREIRGRIEQIYRRQDDLAGLVQYYQTWLVQQPRDVEATLRLSTAFGELDRKPEALEALKKAVAMAPDRKDVKALLARGLIDAKQYDEAVRVLSDLTVSDPEDTRYWIWLGEAYWMKSRPPTAENRAAALASWKKIAPETVKSVGPILQLAEILQSYEMTEETLAEYRRAVELAPDAPEARLRWVEYLRLLKRDDEAQKILMGMVEGDRATAANYLRLASILKRFDKPVEARAMVDRGLELEPGNFDLLSLSWNLYAEEKKWPEVLALFDRMTAAAPNLYFVEQIEIRHLQALASAEQTEAVARTLKERLGGQPSLSEGELRLLARLYLQQNATGDFEKVMDEARDRFPKSASLLRLDAEQKRKSGDLERSVEALQKLVENAPGQKNDWLTELARVRMEQGKPDEGLKVAQQMIDGNPAQASGYLLYADLALAAQRPDEAIAKLKQAIKASEKGNDIRIRLARLYLERSEVRQSREMFDEAFESAESPSDRLALIKPMAEVYFLDGKMDELVARFKQRQAAEEGGWRYGLYLAEMYQQMQDYGAARKELAKSLAQRPADPGLIRQLIVLAEKEGDVSELLKYREQLAAVDSSDGVQIALAETYNDAGRFEEAWSILQKNAGLLGKDPQAWRQVLKVLAGTDLKEKVQRLLEDSLAKQGNEFQSQVTLAEFWLSQGEMDSAAKVLWKVVEHPLPVEALAPASPPVSTPPITAARGISAFFGFMNTGDYSRRAARSYEYMNDGQQLLIGVSGGRGNGIMRRSVSGITTKAPSTPADYRDRALVYLAIIAMKENKADAFVGELDDKLTAGKWEGGDRVVAYALVQAREPLWNALVALVNNPNSTEELDIFAYSSLFNFGIGAQGDDEKKKQVMDLQAILAERLVKRDPDLAPGLALMGVQLAMYGGPENSDRAQVSKLVDKVLEKMDRNSPDQLMSSLQLVLSIRNYDRALEIVGLLEKQDLKKAPPMVMQQLQWLPNYLLSARSNGIPDLSDKKEQAKVPALLLRLLRLRYPSTPPVTGSTTSVRMGSSFGDGQFPPGNRFYNESQRQSLQQIFINLKAAGTLEVFLEELEKEQKAATDWKVIYPQLTKIYFQWWGGKKDEAVAATREILAANASDDFHLLLAAMLSQQQKYAEAMQEIEAVKVRFGPDYILTQQQLLRTAKLAKDTENAKKAALRLAAMRLSQQDRAMLLGDLRELGLKEKAEELGKQLSRSSGSSRNNNYDADRQLYELLGKSTEAKDKDKVLTLARQVLGRDPTATDQGMGEGLRRQALQSLQATNQIKVYLASLRDDLARTPESMRLNLAVSEAIVLDEDKAWLRQRVEYPLWLKLKREGLQLTGYWSRDGKEWIEAGKTTRVEFPGPVYVGLALSNANGPESAVAHWDEVKVTGKTANGWKGVEVGENRGVAGSHAETNGGFRIVSTRGDMWGRKDGAYFVYQTLEGDGEIQGRVAGIENLSGKGEALEWAKAALMIRSDLESGSPGALLAATPGRGIVLQERSKPGLDCGNVAAVSTYQLPLWMRIQRNAEEIVLGQSRDGKEWKEIQRFRVAFGDAPVFAGVITGTGRTGEKVRAIWENLKVSPVGLADSRSEKDNALPAPWQERDLRGGATEGSSRFESNRFVTQAPSDPKASTLMNFLYQPLPKEGELTGKLVQLDAESGWTSLALCSGLEASATRVQISFNSRQDLVTDYNVDAQTAALPYLRKAAGLAPKDMMVQMRIAQYLQSHEARDEALQIYVKMLEQDFSSVMEQQGPQMIQVFDKAGRMEDFFKVMDAWNPPPLTVMGGGANLGYTFLNLGEQMEQKASKSFGAVKADDPNLVDALRLYRKGRDCDYGGSAQLDSKIVGLLRRMGRNEDAARETLDFFEGKSRERPRSALGLQNISYGNQGMRINMGSDGTIYSEEQDLLWHAQELGLFPQVKEILERKQAQNPNNGETLSRMVLMQIMARDKGYETNLKKLQQSMSPQVFSQIGIGGLYVQELARWQEQGAQALKLAVEMKKSYAGNIYQVQSMDWMIARMPRSLEDPAFKAAAIEALTELATTLVDQSASFNRLDSGSALRCLNYMLTLGLVEPSQKLADQMQGTVEFRNNAGMKRQLDQFKDELGFRRGIFQDAVVTGTVAAGAGKEGADVIEWEFCSKQQPGMVRGVPVKGKAAGMELVVMAWSGKNEPAQVKIISNPEVHGSVQVRLPESAQFVSLALRKEGSKETKDATTIIVGKGKNLIRNPGLTIEEKKGQPPAVEGWQGVFPFLIVPGKQGPWGKVPAFSIRSGRNGTKEIVGDPIPVKPGSMFVQSFWVRSEGSYQVGRRYLNEKGEEIRKSFVNNSIYNRNIWGGSQQILSFTPINGRDCDIIPQGTVSIQPILVLNGASDFAGMSLRVMPVEEEVKKKLEAAEGVGGEKIPPPKHPAEF